MGKVYGRLSDDERVSVMLMLLNHCGVREIARTLGRSASTISREIRRQPYAGVLPYEAHRAIVHAHGSAWRCRNRRKLEPGSVLFRRVVRLLRGGWSPLQIAGRLKRMHPDEPSKRVSHETIYRALYVLPRGELRRELLACLRQGRQKRRPRAGGTKRSETLAEELRITARPEEVGPRLVPGHWEGDLIKGERNRSAVATLVERKSRFVLLGKMKAANALCVQECFERLFNQVPPGLRKSLTYDRGREMARHAQLTGNTGVRVFFADPYAPWQRGSNENVNGLIRQYLPKGTDLGLHSQRHLDRIADRLNGRPRKVLDFKTPLEVMEEIMTEHARTILAGKRAAAKRRPRVA